MDVFGCAAGVELRPRQSAKRKRFSEGADDGAPAKRPLTEEAMTAFMHQLNLTTSSSSSSSSARLAQSAGPLNITAVTCCPAASSPLKTTSSPDEPQTRGNTPSQALSSNSDSPPRHQQRLLTPPGSSEPLSRSQRQGLARDESGDTPSRRPSSRHPVHIRVTPATPPLSDGSLSQEDDCEPMEQSCLSQPLPQRAGWRVVLEDLSSDSSDSEMPQRVWIAPELKSLAANQRLLLPPPVLHEIARHDLAVVPWVSREQCFARVLTGPQERGGEGEESNSEEEEERENCL